MLNSIIIPVYKNEESIPHLLKALAKVLESLPDTEVVFVVDGSPDSSYLLLREELPKQVFPSQLLQHSRNFGSFAAIRTGLEYAHGDYFAVMAADLQEPAELMITFMEVLHANKADVVFGQRMARHDSFFSTLCSNLFWSFFQKFVLKDIPKGGVDIFACSRKVRDALLSIKEPNSSLLAQLFWIGYRRTFVPYERKKREHGKSAWSFRRRFRYMVDSIFAFSDLPITIILWLGLSGMCISFITGVTILIAAITDRITVPGYAPTMLAILFFSSLILFTQGLIGLYLWRTFENSKDRPLAIITTKESITPISHQ